MYDNDTFTVDGHTFQFKTEWDESGTVPWEEFETLGTVSGWTRRDKAPGERALSSDRGSKRFYDYAAAVAKGRKEGLSGVDAAKNADSEYDRLRRWCNDQWQYIGVVITLLDSQGDATNEIESLWGIESDAGDYIDEVAHEIAGEIIRRLNSEAHDSEYWARQGVATLPPCPCTLQHMAQV